MDIQQYFEVIWRRKLIVLLTVAAALIVVAIVTSREVPVYQASTTLRVATSAGGQLSYITSTYSTELLTTSAKIATSKPVLDSLKNKLGVDRLPEITVDTIPNTELLKITAEDRNPKLVADAANTLATILIEQSNNVYIGGGISSPEILSEQLAQSQSDLEKIQQEYQNLIVQTPSSPEKIDMAFQAWMMKQKNYDTLFQQLQQAKLQDQIRAQMITIVDPASLPTTPVKPRVAYNYLIGLVAGLVGGLLLAFILASLDSTVYRAKEIEAAAGFQTVANIPKANQSKLNIFLDGDSEFAEGIRKLAANIERMNQRNPRNAFLVMSAEPGQGKTTIIHNLALALAEHDKRVVVVDGDLRLPDLHTLFGVENVAGLKEVLEQNADLETVLQKSSQNGVSVLTAGTSEGKPWHLLGSSRMKEIIARLCDQFEFVLIDTPAMLAVADAQSIAGLVEGVLMVVCKGNAKKESIQAASKFLKTYPDQWVGLVVNQDQRSPSYAYYRSKLKSGRKPSSILKPT